MLIRKYGDKEGFLKEMREYGFDVRTHNTNRTIPIDHFRICYPFTLPIELSKYKLWSDSFGDKISDFNILSLTDRNT